SSGRGYRCAERYRWHHGRGEGHCDQGNCDRHFLSAQARTSAPAGAAPLRRGEARSNRHSRQCARNNLAQDLCQRAFTLAFRFALAQARGPQICARPCGCHVGTCIQHWRGKTWRAWRAAGRRRPRYRPAASGRAHRPGARSLGAPGPLGAGAGLVAVASPRDAIKVNAAQLTAIMVREADDARALASLLADERKNAVLIGPGVGLGERTKELVRAALASKAAVVLDADAITSFADDAKQLFAALKSREAPVVMTPHDGEFARLFGDLQAASKLERARAAAARSCR